MIYSDGVHVVADTLQELHTFMRRIGVGEHWYHRSSRLKHYDLPVRLRRKILDGVSQVSSKEIVRKAKVMQ